MKKPANVVYGHDDAPPVLVTAFNGVQHVALLAINLVYPLLVFRAAGVEVALVTQLLAIGMFVLGIGTFLQVLRLGPIGSGYLCPSTFTAAYLGPSLLAVKAGGLPVLFAMTMFGGALEGALSRLLTRLRPIFPPELSGLVIFMVGLGAGIAGVRSLAGESAPPVTSEEWWVAAVTLGTMIALNIWGRGVARMLCALIGMIAGYAAAAGAGLLHGTQLAAVADAPWVGLPDFGHLDWTFDAALAAPFAIASIAVAMKAVGTIAMCQRMNDANWVRTDMRSATRGVLSDGASTVLAGALGAMGTNTSTPSVGLAAATGVTSRRVAYAAGALLLLCGLTPKLAALLAVMPRSVMVAALLFAVAFIIINGLQMMTSRLLDARRTLVIGLAIVAGSAVDVFPVIAASAPGALMPLVASPLAFATIIALALNLVFRLGVRKTASIAFERGDVDPQKLEDFFRTQGALWGARPDVVTRATFGALQLLDAVRDHCWRSGRVAITASFDEFNLDVRVSYEGEPLEFPEARPTNAEIVEREDGSRRLAGYMLRRYADRLLSGHTGGTASVHLHYDH